MRFFAHECPDRLIGQQSADQLPWFHIITLITKLSDHTLRNWYACEAIEQSWPRETLKIQIDNHNIGTRYLAALISPFLDN